MFKRSPVKSRIAPHVNSDSCDLNPLPLAWPLSFGPYNIDFFDRSNSKNSVIPGAMRFAESKLFPPDKRRQAFRKRLLIARRIMSVNEQMEILCPSTHHGREELLEQSGDKVIQITPPYQPFGRSAGGRKIAVLHPALASIVRNAPAGT